MSDKPIEPDYDAGRYGEAVLALRLNNLLSHPSVPPEVKEELLNDPRLTNLMAPVNPEGEKSENAGTTSR